MSTFMANKANIERKWYILDAAGKPLGLYIHIPFCKSKCVYCDFYSLAGKRPAFTTVTC